MLRLRSILSACRQLLIRSCPVRGQQWDHLAFLVNNLDLWQTQLNNFGRRRDSLDASLYLLHLFYGSDWPNRQHGSLENDSSRRLQAQKISFPNRLNGRQVTVDELPFEVSANVDVGPNIRRESIIYSMVRTAVWSGQESKARDETSDVRNVAEDSGGHHGLRGRLGISNEAYVVIMSNSRWLKSKVEFTQTNVDSLSGHVSSFDNVSGNGGRILQLPDARQ